MNGLCADCIKGGPRSGLGKRPFSEVPESQYGSESHFEEEEELASNYNEEVSITMEDDAQMATLAGFAVPKPLIKR